MYKLICVVVITVLLLDFAQGKRLRKNKYVNEEAQESTPQPSVLTYSTFGFNDVGPYDGFLPTSPEYVNYLKNNREQATRLYAPAFPSAADTSFASNNEPLTSEAQSINTFQPASMNFFTSPNAEDDGKDEMASGGVYGHNINEDLAYGTKLSLKSKNKLFSDFNNTGINIYASITDSQAPNENTAFEVHMPNPSDHKTTSGDSIKNHPNIFRNLPPQYEVHEPFENAITSTTTSATIYKYPKVLDFTKYQQNYPTSIENKYVDMSQKPFNLDALVSGDENSNKNSYATNHNHQEKYEYKDPSDDSEGTKFNRYKDSDNSIRIGQSVKHNKIYSEYKDKLKRPLQSNNEDRTRFKSNMKGYEYSTNHSSTSFKFDYGPPKSKFNSSVDEIAPASSNLGFTSYQLPDNQYPDLGKIPNVKNYYDGSNSNKPLSFYQEKPEEEPIYEYQSPYTTFPTHMSQMPTHTSHWGNIFKETDITIHKTHPYKPQNEESEVIYIPKKHENQNYVKQHENPNYVKQYESPNYVKQYENPNYVKQNENPNYVKQYESPNYVKQYENPNYVKQNENPNYVKQYENNPSEWSYPSNYRPKPNHKPQMEWNDNMNNRYKSEEDLLGLRNPDMPQPSHSLFKPNYDFEDDFDYRKVVEKWRQNYIKSKQKDTLREYESYASDSKPVRVPVPRPYPIEVPHPVIVPVPQPYPVNVPIPKPVAVPIIREVTVPVEKPVPYPVIKNVPYPVEKPVAVPVVKQVHVPVVKPYPVAVPHIKPVFHHSKGEDKGRDSMGRDSKGRDTKGRDTKGRDDEEDDYPPRPEKKPYYKKSKYHHSRPRSPPIRRPSRMTYQVRKKRPYRSSYSSSEHRYRRPSPYRDHRPHRYHDDEEDDEPSDYALYCKRTGKC